jgi:hypothetical protein
MRYTKIISYCRAYGRWVRDAAAPLGGFAPGARIFHKFCNRSARNELKGIIAHFRPK